MRDPILLELVRHSLDAIVDEMALSLVKTAHSINLKSTMDICCAICDRDGRVLVQGETLPLNIGAIPIAMKAVLGKFADDVSDGDLFILNDPFHGGSHLPDFYLFKPVFLDGRHVAWSMSEAHHLDVGGLTPGGNGTDAVEIFQEGLRIPPIRLYAAHQPVAAVFDIIATNVRVPDYVLGDLRAQIAACEIGERFFLALAARYGLDVLMESIEALLDQSEKYARAAIAAMPDGSYEFTDHLDGDGIDDAVVPIKVTLTVSGDRLVADFAGSSSRVAGAINATMSPTCSAVYAAVRYLIPGNPPNNEGFFRPIEIRAPEGSIVNAVAPAPVAARGLTAFRIGNVVFGALSKIAPGRVFACEVGADSGISFASTDTAGRAIVFLEFLCGSWGARPHADGIDGCSSAFVNFANNSVELIEWEYPMVIERYGYVPDTGGAGRHRGGLALERHYRFEVDRAQLQLRTDRTRFRPYGIYDGEPGARSSSHLLRDGSVIDLPGKCKIAVQRGDVLRHQLAGAGGWGPASERDPAAVREDILDGKITVEHARRHYGAAADAIGARASAGDALQHDYSRSS